MANTYTQIYIQVVFAVSGRANLLLPEYKGEVNKYITGIVSWQEGFGAFSYAHSQLDAVVRYICNQESHHSRTSFRDEYLTLLRKFDVAFERKYIFDFLDEPATPHVAPTGLGE